MYLVTSPKTVPAIIAKTNDLEFSPNKKKTLWVDRFTIVATTEKAVYFNTNAYTVKKRPQ